MAELKEGNVGIEDFIIPDVKEKKVTLYHIHPTAFGKIIKSPNLPYSPEKLRDYVKRGFRTEPRRLPFVEERTARIEEDPNGELWAVPPGYKLEGVDEEIKVPTPDGQFRDGVIDTTYRVVRTEKPEAPEGGFACDVCGKVCKTKLALSGHKKTHK